MAVLSDDSRRELWAEFQSELSRDTEPLAVNKAELRVAVDALDDFFSTNAATVNAAIPQPARSALTTPQKARLLVFVIRQRYLKGA